MVQAQGAATKFKRTALLGATTPCFDIAPWVTKKMAFLGATKSAKVNDRRYKSLITGSMTFYLPHTCIMCHKTKIIYLCSCELNLFYRLNCQFLPNRRELKGKRPAGQENQGPPLAKDLGSATGLPLQTF